MRRKASILYHYTNMGNIFLTYTTGWNRIENRVYLYLNIRNMLIKFFLKKRYSNTFWIGLPYREWIVAEIRFQKRMRGTHYSGRIPGPQDRALPSPSPSANLVGIWKGNGLCRKFRLAVPLMNNRIIEVSHMQPARCIFPRRLSRFPIMERVLPQPDAASVFSVLFLLSALSLIAFTLSPH